MNVVAPRVPIAISTGDPGGIGPEIALRAALELRSDEQLVLFGDARWLAARAREIGGSEPLCHPLDPGAAHFEVPRGRIGIVDVGRAWSQDALSHRATAAGGDAQLRALDAAIAAAQSGRARGLVTAPMSKAAVNLAGHDFIGHTEHLARSVGLADDGVTMMFLGPRLRVALVTTHIAIADAPVAITRERVLRSVLHLAEALVRLRSGSASSASGERGQAARVVVTGLNPHAGEGGLFGTEEPTAIAPAIEQARARWPFTTGLLTLEGPVPAETAFRSAASGQIDAIVAMLHDQATIASKLLDWGNAVNVTWGLPFVRTSVDHGVAYAAAESGAIEVEGMRSAVALARSLTQA